MRVPLRAEWCPQGAVGGRSITAAYPVLWGIPSVDLTSCSPGSQQRLTGDLSPDRKLCDVDTGNGWDLTARSRAGSGHLEVMLGVMDVMGSWAPTGCGVKDFCHRPGGFKT
jgi:hypothetical protein